ncbi:type III pantothenate kinase [Leptospirillum ferriphilum]|jgi:type III pantothenate kinase|uniref:Type III pantothenate kinase n=2 Tax=Leptospirillum ferriphilum TaxID=178606 RepID=A0A059XSR7_9BACT|nr:type III pantothenate kinase [Leptospirillum ferriphilum]AIA31654.1 hypothetical protein Y981_05185 [Leptospirillum ferriphilum YSK]OOH75066.1 hypothetical protein BOX24_00580 [Leptospirillum ferriphilum]OOH78503.1 hypothetical protein BOX30_08240 [Leptospirillum ferriphilum]
MMITVKLGVSRVSVALHDASGRIRSLLVRKTPRKALSPAEWKNHLALPPVFWEKDCPVGIVSVVPAFTAGLEKALSGPEKRRIVLLDRSSWGLKILYTPPSSLGLDRLAASRGAMERFPDLEGRTYVVADFGTHTVLTVVDGRSVLGGSIALGIGPQLETISQRLVLGKVPLTFPKKPLGETTLESLTSGVILGTVRGVEGLVGEMEESLGKRMMLVLTGGFARYVRPLIQRECYVDRHLIHRGTWRVAQEAGQKDKGQV